MKLKILLYLAILSVFCLAGCSRKRNFLEIKGSDTMVNAAQKLGEEFVKKYPNIMVGVTGGGSGVGVASLINKTTHIATMSREISSKEIEIARGKGVEPNELVIGYDGVALIVNTNNPVSQLSINNLHRIFTGEVTNWKEFGGKDLTIVKLSREVSSGTYTYFKEQVVRLGKKGATEEFSNDTLLLSSSQAIVEEVVANEGAIGYLGMGYVSDRTKAIKVSKTGEFYPPDVDNVISKKYPLSRPLYFYTDGPPKGIAKIFIEFAMSPLGQQQIVDSGFVPRFKTSAEEN